MPCSRLAVHPGPPESFSSSNLTVITGDQSTRVHGSPAHKLSFERLATPYCSARRRVPSIGVGRLDQLRDPLMGEAQHATGVTHGHVSLSDQVTRDFGA